MCSPDQLNLPCNLNHNHNGFNSKHNRHQLVLHNHKELSPLEHSLRDLQLHHQTRLLRTTLFMMILNVEFLVLSLLAQRHWSFMGKWLLGVNFHGKWCFSSRKFSYGWTFFLGLPLIITMVKSTADSSVVAVYWVNLLSFHQLCCFSWKSKFEQFYLF